MITSVIALAARRYQAIAVSIDPPLCTKTMIPIRTTAGPWLKHSASIARRWPPGRRVLFPSQTPWIDTIERVSANKSKRVGAAEKLDRVTLLIPSRPRVVIPKVVVVRIVRRDFVVVEAIFLSCINCLPCDFARRGDGVGEFFPRGTFRRRRRESDGTGEQPRKEKRECARHGRHCRRGRGPPPDSKRGAQSRCKTFGDARGSVASAVSRV
jgi:hypothetical protein